MPNPSQIAVIPVEAVVGGSANVARQPVGSGVKQMGVAEGTGVAVEVGRDVGSGVSVGAWVGGGGGVAVGAWGGGGGEVAEGVQVGGMAGGGR